MEWVMLPPTRPRLCPWGMIGAIDGGVAMKSPSTAQHGSRPDRGHRPGRIFYGWFVVTACFGILAVAYGVQFSYGVFLPAMAADTGWDRTSLSIPFSIYIFIYSILGAATGWSTDRWGPRIVVASGALLLGCGLGLTSQADAQWQLYLFLGLIAAFGMSAVYVPCNATVVRWFTRRRGLALGISASGQSFGTLLVPPLAALLIAAYGWRATYLGFALVGAALLLLCSTLMVRDPERMGLSVDGAPRHPTSPPGDFAADPQWTLASARRTAVFWLLVAVYTLTWLVAFLPMVHLAPFALDLGISPVRAALAISLIGAGSLAGRLLCGTISDRVGRLPLLGAGLVLEALAFLGFWASTGVGSLYPSAVLFGLAVGATSILMPAIIGDFFGRLAVGAILGFAWAISASAASFGPFIAGYLFDRTGSYDSAFLLSVALNLAAASLVLLLKKPVPKTAGR